ncbi:helix-turn-helix transcriptional regulator [Clostridium transplantifaecale]|uniref:helix-turn-helix transcriptional regulator n=1 Tax=Clostridium transplantifaecale TaxID=2479838 RepID=UPI0013DE0CDA|nr:AraC family transcriptional regulator [Clostridium transplantifaecale]
MEKYGRAGIHSEESSSVEVFEVLPGIKLVYSDFTAWERPSCPEEEGGILEIDYCHEGREECRWVCGDYLYLGPGDLCITRRESSSPSLRFPTGHYRGITVVLDLTVLRTVPLPLVDSRTLALEGMADKFCPGSHFFAMRANAYIAHIFSELYDIPEAVRNDYFKIKVLELLMYLRLVDPEEQRLIDKATRNQSDVVKNIKERLCEDLSQEFTVEELAREFCISKTALKSNFKLFYHASVKEYLRRIRMERAAELLIHTEIPVGGIASQLGYANQSKFASVFKQHHGISPMEYRRKCRHGER